MSFDELTSTDLTHRIDTGERRASIAQSQQVTSHGESSFNILNRIASIAREKY